MAAVVTRDKIHVKKGDVVEVINGAEKGKSGKVLTVLPKKRVAIIEGVNMIKKHMRKSQNQPEGGIVEKEGPLAVAKLRVVEAAGRPERKSEKGE
ncbi:MAG TPA: 50S ribosomal protein L24 [Kiritimatiellia bacterium]|mgnify:CR=1 FL=1|nr:50S ribosomal protein L24 [Kiritimatiellia bacterium]